MTRRLSAIPARWIPLVREGPAPVSRIARTVRPLGPMRTHRVKGGRSSQATPTEKLLWQMQCVNLPAPEGEVRFHPTRKWRFDLGWKERRLAVEIEGLTREGGRHQRVEGFSEDLRKYNEALVMGWRVVRVTPAMIKTGEAVRMIERAYG